MKKYLRWAGFLIVAAGIAAALIYGLKPRPILLEGVQVARGPLEVSFTEEGKTRVVDRYLISSPVAGFARRLDLDVGDAIQAGQVVLRLDPLKANVLDRRSRAEAQSRVAAAEAALESAKQQVEASRADARFWEGELARTQELADSGTIARDKLDQAVSDQRKAQATLRSAEFQVEVARHDLEAARTALRYSAAEDGGRPSETVAVRAPVGGRVLKIFHESEGAVAAAEPLLEVGDPRGLEVVVEALSSDAVKVGPGTRALLERWGGDDPLEAVVRRIEPVAFTKISALGVEEQRVLAILDITSPKEEWERLGDGYRVEARFILWEGDNVLQVPTSALFRDGDGWAVFVVEGGLARKRGVEPGPRGGLMTQVLAGVEEGETLIAHPGESVSDGAAVDVVSH